ELVAAPLPRPEARRAPEVVERPREQPAPVEPVPDPEPEPETPEPEPAPIQTPEETEPVPEAAEKPVTPLPGETPSTGSDIANVKTPGLEFPYPNYLRNIVAQVLRRWNRPTGPSELRAEVSFLIMRDGSVRDIRFVTPSGNFSFDLAAQGAIEAAANTRAFGALPDGYPADILPVSFFFSPRTPE
ncbi:MAG: TonB C-terminal domain-containing protein, partial [Gemmatimonadales bacterium]